MLIYSTIIILWTFVPCFITSLPQYNQQSDNNTNDNNNSSYHYKYIIDDSDKQNQGKDLEGRFDESASGQYHANGDQSSTDIKYFLDEWGYHPLVKYRVPNEYTAADTHLAFDLHKSRVVINNSKINEDEILIESQQTATDEKILPIDNWYENTYGPISIKDIPEKMDISNNSNNNNNNLELQQHQWVDDQVNQYPTETVVGTEPIVDFPSIEELVNSKTSADSNNQDNLNITDIIKPSTAVDDALLLSENFGKKIYHSNLNFEQLNNSKSDTGVGASHTYYVSAETPLKKNDKTISPNIGVSSQNYKNALANFKTQLIKNSQMSKNNKGLTTNTKVLPELSRLTFQSFNDGTENLSGIQHTGVTENPQIIIETKFNSQEPIVVAETSMTTENYEYSTTFPCNNQEEEIKNIKSVSLLPTATTREETIPPEQRQSSTDERTLYNIVNSPLFVQELSHRGDQYTTSPMILNSIQAGLALVNAERTHLIGQNIESSLTNVEPAVHQLENQFKLNNRHSSFYITQSDEISIYKNKSLENINSQSDESIKLSSVPNVTLASINHDNASDKLVEIQKSQELYHSAPIHEIHYPAQLTSQVVTKIDHSPSPDLVYPTTQKHNQQQYNNNHQISDIPHQKNQMSYTDITDLTNSNTDYNYQFISIFDQTSHTTTKTTDQQDKFSNSLNLNNNNNFLDIVQQKIVKINDNNNNKNSTVDNLKIPVQNNIVAQINSTRMTRENLTQDKKNLTSLSSDFFEYSSQWNKLNDKSIHSNKETQDIAENVNFKIDSNQWLEPIADRLNYRNNNNNNNNHYRQNNQPNDSKITTSSNSNLPPHQIDINLNKEEEKQQQQQYYHSIEDDKIISDATDNSKQTVYIYTPSVTTSDYGSIQTNYNSQLPTNRIINREFNSDNVESLLNYPVDKFVEGILDMKAASRPYSVNKDRVLENLQQQKHQNHQKHQQQKQKHVPVIQDYPVTVQKMLENKVPSPYPIETTTTSTSTSTSTSTTCIHKLVSQPYPIHILEQLPYQVDKVIEMPMRIPTYHPLEIPLRLPLPLSSSSLSSSSSSSTLSTKLSEKSLNNEPYYGNGIRYGVNYQQIMNPSINGLYPVRFKETNYGELEKLANSSNQNFQGYIYGKQSVIPVVGLRSALSKRYGSLNQLGHAKHQNQNQNQKQQQIINYHPAVISKKQFFSNVLNQLPILIHHPKSVIDHIDLRWHVTHPTEKYKKNKIEYVGPVPLLQPQQVLNLDQNQVPHPAHQESIYYSEPSDTSSSPSFSSTSLSSFFKRVRLPEVHYYGKMGNFRQSKMEYGFKPPMVPSIQYDENTATKVDNS